MTKAKYCVSGFFAAICAGVVHSVPQAPVLEKSTSLSPYCGVGGEGASPLQGEGARKAEKTKALLPSKAGKKALAPGGAKTSNSLTDVDSWRVIRNAELTPNGQWLAYMLRTAATGELDVVLRSTWLPIEYRYRAGNEELGAGKLQISPSGSWIAFQASPVDHGDGLPDRQRPVRLTTALVDVASGKRMDFPNSASFAFGGELNASHDDWIALQHYPTQKRSTAFDLMLRRLSTDQSLTLSGVHEFSFSSRGIHLGVINENGLHLLNLLSGDKRILDGAGRGQYCNLTWSDSGNALAVFRRTMASHRTTASTTSVADARMVGADTMVVFTKLDTDQPIKQVFAADSWDGPLAGYEFTTEVVSAPFLPPYTPRKALIWRKDDTGIFFGLRAIAMARQAGIYEESPAESDPQLLIWHWKGTRLPAQTSRELESGRTLPDLGFASLEGGRVLRLTDSKLRYVEPRAAGQFLLGFDPVTYDRQYDLTGRRLNDYYLVDLSGGQRSLIIDRLEVSRFPIASIHPTMSPDGSVVLYQNEGHFIVYDIASRTHRNVTRTLHRTFQYLRSHEVPSAAVPALQGWTADGTGVLVSDQYDVWALSLKDAKHALNLTKNGRSGNIRYMRSTLRPDPLNYLYPYDARGEIVDLQDPMYFRAIDLDDFRSGLALYSPGREALTPLHWEHANVRFYKAERADIHVATRESSTEFPDYFAVDVDDNWTLMRRLTDANPQQRDLKWSPGSKLVTYNNPTGETHRSILHLPVGYVEGVIYPAIVSIYEEKSYSLHTYKGPHQDEDVWRWTQNGYAVLQPDIHPRLNAPGASALEGVLAGVKAATSTGIVDANRMCLTGFSYGGYETNFIITQTTIFKCAISKAGISNLLSSYGAVYAPLGLPNTAIMESTQPYMGGPWWDYWEEYVKNSPLYHVQNVHTPLLVIHGDRDTSAAFSQSVEFFNNLRRLESKPVVLLQYVGEGHIISKSQDMDRREMEFFDHFLKGAPSPAWWSSELLY